MSKAKFDKNKDVELLRTAIREKGLRQDVLARKVGYTPVYLCYILKYKVNFSDRAKKRFFKELGIK